MSESYHEIFDTLMPPETAKAKIQSENVQTPDRLADAPSIQPATSSILPGMHCFLHFSLRLWTGGITQAYMQTCA